MVIGQVSTLVSYHFGFTFLPKIYTPFSACCKFHNKDFLICFKSKNCPKKRQNNTLMLAQFLFLM